MTILGKLKASEIKTRALKLLEVNARVSSLFFAILMHSAAAIF
jgi:hypothetical protein